MEAVRYHRATNAEHALHLAGTTPGAAYLGGGTNLVDLMRENLERPSTLIDVRGFGTDIEVSPAGTLIIGAAARNSDVAAHEVVRRDFPLLARALLAGASGQIRNSATMAGNLLQRTRCGYFYDSAARCNKREPGSGCDAIGGVHRNHAVLGGSPHCIATHPSDAAVALAALDAVVRVRSRSGERLIRLTDLHRLPGDRPDVDTNLHPGELVTSLEVPNLSFGRRSAYRKVRDRASYAFALVSVATALDVADGTVRGVRLALGGVAPLPWRARRAEDALLGGPADPAAFRAAAVEEMSAAQALPQNRYKVDMAVGTITHVLTDLAGATR